MIGKELISQMKKLRDVERAKDIRQLTYSIFPGPHCPLMGAMLAVRSIKDACMMVVGTEECTYYTKSTTMNNMFGGMDSPCFSVVMNYHDVAFGSHKKIEEAFAELMSEYTPKAVFLISTCLGEIIGDDIDAMAETFSKQYGIHVAPVHTEHFKSENHIPGIANAVTACLHMMKDMPKGNGINVLGQRFGSFSSTELFRVLSKAGCEVGMALPGGCSVSQIETAASAKVNIVVDATALELAKGMKESFGTPYVRFERFAAPADIFKAYTELFGYLEASLPSEVEDLHKQAVETVGDAKPSLKNVRYIYGNTPLPTYEFNAFMVSMGMIPQLIQTVELPEKPHEYLDYILENSDPYVVKSANIAPLQYVYDEMKPHLYLGHEYALRLRQKGISLVRTDQASAMLGFEVTQVVLSELTRAAAEAKELEKERAS
ncbi:MAG: nitrogenase component 1 [Oscillospiraceae bacterium]|nr:nitrogenase component 1 [Oscillospiraceae bacterium]